MVRQPRKWAPLSVMDSVKDLQVLSSCSAALGTPQTIQANVERGQELEKAAQGFPARKAILGNLEAMNQQFTSGPFSHDISVAKKQQMKS